MDTILKSRDLDAGYNGTPVVRNVNIDLHEGEIIALIGPNGTGKTSILKTVSGQLKPVRGNVYLYGRDIRSIPDREIARTISLLMTEHVDPELMTCGDVVSIGRYPYTGLMGRLSAHDREIIGQAMELTGVAELRDRYYSRISDGQKQRVLLAKAVCQEPKVLIMDEPTSFLDIRYKLELLETTLRLVREKKLAVISAFHELELARRIADTVICVKDGHAKRAENADEAFRPEQISTLFDISEEQYRWLQGTDELP